MKNTKETPVELLEELNQLKVAEAQAKTRQRPRLGPKCACGKPH